MTRCELHNIPNVNSLSVMHEITDLKILNRNTDCTRILLFLTVWPSVGFQQFLGVLNFTMKLS